MLRWLNNSGVVIVCAILFASCELVDLRPVGMKIEPAESDSLLPNPNSPVILSFDTEMERHEAESILQISCDSGTVNGDRYWNGNALYFVPVPGWTAGVRYTLSLSGTLRSVDGRELRLERFVSFYAINKSAPPLLDWHSPADGASVGTGDVIMEFHFSCPMERLSVESALVVEGMGNKTFEWSDDDRILRVFPEKSLAAWTVYRWTLKESARSRDGVPLPRTISAQFATNLDQVMPRVQNVYPVLHSQGRWLPTGFDIETGLGPSQGIAVEFNKVMGENVLRSLRFEPAISGRTELLSEKTVLYIPSRDIEPETAYTLIVSGDTRDSEGLKIGRDFRISFVADIPFLKVLSFNADGVPVLESRAGTYNGDLGSVLGVRVGATGEFSFTIWFSLNFTTEEKQNAATKIYLETFFPKNLPSVALNSVSWISNDRLRMTWEGLRAGSSTEEHYYRLVIPGGKGGITNGGGMYFKEDQYLYLEAVK